MPKSRFDWLDAMRGIAACWVLLLHASLAARDFAGPLPAWGRVLANGYLGVDFFFVLSGFIIATSSRELVARGKGWGDYASARAIRIYVPYLPVGIGMVVLYALMPGISQGVRADTSLFTSLTLLPGSAPPALSVAWTLVHEVIFYALFGLYFFSRRGLFWLLAVWSGAIVLVWASGQELPRAAGYVLSPLNLSFVLGVLIAWMPALRGHLVGAAAISGVVLVASQALAVDPSRIVVAAGFGCTVFAARSARGAPWRGLTALGAASYSVYLVHNPVISAIARLHVGGPVAALLVTAAGGLAAGLAYHRLYERRALRWVKDRRHGLTVLRAE